MSTPRALVPMVHVQDVERSIAFYNLLGFQVGNRFQPPGAPATVWAWLESGRAQLMLVLADGPVVPEQQAVLFYVYYDDVAAAHAECTAAGLAPGPVTPRFYAPQGEFRLIDPDGYVLMVMNM